MHSEVTRSEFEEYCHKVDGIETFINVLGGQALLRQEATWQKALEDQGGMMLRILEEIKKLPTREELDSRFETVEKGIKTMQGDIKAIYNLLEQRLP